MADQGDGLGLGVSRVDARRGRLRLDSGLEVATLDWGGTGPLLLLHHASGFCAGVWHEIAAVLRAHFRVVAFDARGHGDSSPASGRHGWHAFADDLVEVARALVAALGYRRVDVAVGHSLGGTAVLLAAGKADDLFGRAILIDPVLVTPELAAEFAVRADGHTAVSLATRMRRSVFTSRTDAIEEWRSQALYAHWDPRVLEDYAQEGLRAAGDGKLRLKCSPSFEASIYALGETPGVFAEPSIPVLALVAQGSRFAACHERLAAISARVALRPITAGHLAPMEQPAAIAAIIRDFGSGDGQT